MRLLLFMGGRKALIAIPKKLTAVKETMGEN